MASPISIAEKLCTAMNMKYGTHIVINTNKFFGKEDMVVKMHVVKDVYGRGRAFVDEELFRSASSIYICLFMRDLMYSFEGRDIPEGDEGWEHQKETKPVAQSIDYMRKKYLADKL